MQERIKSFLQGKEIFGQRYNFNQKIIFLSLIFFLILIPITLEATLSKVNLSSRAFLPVPSPIIPSSLSSPFGKAIKISDASSFVKINPSATLNIQSNFTVEGWIKLTNNQFMNDTNPHYILAKETADGEAPGYALGVTNRKPEFRIFLIRSGQPPVNLVLTGKTTLEFDRWYHLAGVRMANNLYLLLNGQLEATAVIDQGGYGYEREGRMLTIGCVKILNFPACMGNFYGEIDEVRISATARLPKDSLPPLAPFFPDQFTLGLWHFNNDVNDASGNSNHGEIIGEIKFVDSDLLPATTPSSQPTISPTPSPFNQYAITYNLTLANSPDWQTNELYQYNVSYQINTQGTKNNLYSIKIALNQAELSSLPNVLYAKTTLPVVYGETPMEFEFRKIGIGTYQTGWLNVNYQNCFDLYSQKTYQTSDYLGTGCFKIYSVQQGRNVIYSLNSKISVEFNYRGDPLLVLTGGPLFDRKATISTQPQIVNNPKGERVSYFVYDTNVRNKKFYDLKYIVSGITASSDLESLNQQICDIQKAKFHRTFNQSLPSGGEFLYYKEKIGSCSFGYYSSYFLYGYLSHAPMIIPQP
ncbi:MAG: LamG-like jellyroll fold domain-containing protein [Microgenomates group bacterium]